MPCPKCIATSAEAVLHHRSLPAKCRSVFRRDEDRGQSAVELALCLPVLLLILTGITTFGLAFNNYIMLTQATDVGARTLSINRGQTTDPCALTASAVYAAAPTLKQANLGFTIMLNGASYSGTSCSSGSTSSGAAANLAQGTSAEVQVTYPCSLVVFRANYATNCVLTAKTTELVQ